MQLASRKPSWQRHEPSLCAVPWPEHVEASECSQEGPTRVESAHVWLQSLEVRPVSQRHEPSLCAAPRPEHVEASEYWHPFALCIFSNLRECEKVGGG